VEQDYAKAMECYQQSADMDNAYAYTGIGDLYRYGKGVEQDYAKAAEYYTLAAEQGVPDGLFLLGECCYERQDLDKAAEWYRKALEAGYEPKETEQAHLKEVLGDGYQQK
jgi:hypothetical protein